MSIIEARVQSRDQAKFVGTVGQAQHQLTMDAGPDYGGGDSGPRPTEVLLIALGGCTAIAVKEILRAKRQKVTGLEVVVRGTRAEEWPKAFTEIHVEYIVRGQGVDESAVARAVQLSEEKYCTVANSLKARLVSSYRIVEENVA